MMTCCLFGHHDCAEEISSVLFSVLKNLIENATVDTFYVGEQGNFDRIALKTLTSLKSKHPCIRFYVILPYLPKHPSANSFETILPEGIEKVFPRYAISWRNRWMIQHSDVVVLYVKHGYGGAAQAMEYAKKCRKIVINIAT